MDLQTLADRLEIEDGEGLQITCAGIPVPEGDFNLVARAAAGLADGSAFLGSR